jgi:transposase
MGVEEWKLGFTTHLGAKPRLRVMPARDLGRLAREIAEAKKSYGLKASAAVRSCYEAGRDGFWLHRYWSCPGFVDGEGLSVQSWTGTG